MHDLLAFTGHAQQNTVGHSQGVQGSDSWSCSCSKPFVLFPSFQTIFSHASLLYCRLELVSQLLINFKLFLLEEEKNIHIFQSPILLCLHTWSVFLPLLWTLRERPVVCVYVATGWCAVMWLCMHKRVSACECVWPHSGMYKHARNTQCHLREL